MSETHIPPQNLDAEEHVLGAMMLSKSAIATIADEVRPEDFYRESHAVIFATALELDARGEPVDALTLRDALERKTLRNGTNALEFVGGPVRIHSLAALVPAVANAPHHARIVREAARRRDLIQAGSEVSRLGWEGNGDVDDLIAKAEQAVSGVSSRYSSGEATSLSGTLSELFSQISLAVESGKPISGLMTGFHDLDELTTGLYGGTLTVIAARPKVGKSMLGQNIAEWIADHAGPVGFFSYEMSKRELALRSAVRETKLDLQRVRTGRLTPPELEQLRGALDKIGNRPVFYEDNPGVTMNDLRARARRLKAKKDIVALFVDYLQLMLSGHSSESRQVEVAAISRGLKLLAKELDIPVIAISQLSRAVEARTEKRPMLSDLRDSGAIEQDADAVWFLYRESLYKQVSADKQNDTELIVAANRMGAPGTVNLLFLGKRQTFANPARL